MNWLNYHHLMYFKTIATEGSISRASEKLMVGQPALSAQLKQLEESFGHKLFERRNRKLIITDAGKAALKYANQISSLGIELQNVLNDKTFSVRPRLQIGALDSVPKNLIIKLIKSAQALGECHVTALDGTGDELYRQLVAHSIDLVVSNYHLVSPDQKSTYSKTIGKVPIRVYGARQYKRLQKNFPKSLGGCPMVLPTPHSKLRHDVEHFFFENDLALNVVADAQDTSIQKLLATEGMGLIVEPEFAVEALIKEKKIFEIGRLEGVFEEFFLTSTKRVVENPIVTQLMKTFSFPAGR